ncbi:hypothetical protein ACQPZX_08550 [Actinoplanes sp. CA-142083]|uniref:hypothetical protein n=1 Tax=Actinoplanes sp. CA-142083 TaxID=3239903 RepID=UPI003D90CB87
MTTQLPYGPPQHPQWGQQQPPPYQYGGLMVPHPELIHVVGRPKPSWKPVAAWTFFFGIFGIISAARRADKAKRVGQDQGPYWIAFGVTLVVAGLFWTIVPKVLLTAYIDHRRGAVAKSIEGELMNRPAAKGAHITAADCKPLDATRHGGDNAYSCHVTLSSGSRGTVTVRLNSDGSGTITDQN